VLLDYLVLVNTKEIKDNYEIPRTFSFSFIKKNNRIRFSGLQTYGEGYSRPVNDSTTRARLYFPLYSETQDPKTNLNSLDTFINLLYSAYLSDFRELNLYKYEGEDDVYRFTWLRSFHNPVTIRFQKHRNEYILTTKEISEHDKYITNIIINNTTQYLTASEWNKWIFKLGRMNFWKKETHDPDPSSATDGAMWILEANVKGKYHFVTRQFLDAQYRECCKYLLFLSKLKIAKEDIY
jgi:hypothetical protein